MRQSRSTGRNLGRISMYAKEITLDKDKVAAYQK